MQSLLMDLWFVRLEGITVWCEDEQSISQQKYKWSLNLKFVFKVMFNLRWHKSIVQCCSMLSEEPISIALAIYIWLFSTQKIVKKAFNKILPCWSSMMPIVLTKESIKLFIFSSAIFWCYADYRCTFSPRLPSQSPFPNFADISYFLLNQYWPKFSTVKWVLVIDYG